MIDWNSENWGGKVHLASDGSWVADKHGADGGDHTNLDSIESQEW